MIGVLLLGVLAAMPDDGAGDGAIDQQVRLTLRPEAIGVEVVLTLGRQAAFAEVLQIDRDRDGRLSPEEQSRYFASLEESIRSGLELRVGGQEVALRRAAELRLEMPFRKIYRFEAARSGGRVEFHNENFPSSPGAASIVVEAEPGIDVAVEGDPGALGRDLVCDVSPGRGRVEGRQAEPPALPGTPVAALLLRGVVLIGLGGALLLAWRRRRGAAGLMLAASALAGTAAGFAALPSTEDAERIFLTLHEDSVRADGSVRRVKPLETRIRPTLGFWGPDVRVHHRWRAYGSVAHSGHAHAEVREDEGRFALRWENGAWRLKGAPAPRFMTQ